MKNLVALMCAVGALSAGAETLTMGSSISVGQGDVKSFVITNDQGAPTSLGFMLSANALNGLPVMDQVFDVPWPARISVPPYDHLTMDWNAHGHEPVGVYSVPHFDFHFYMLSKDSQDKITCTDSDRQICLKQPAPDKIAENYVAAPEGVPKMGWHWVDITSPEFHGQPFTATFIYGYYDGELTFVEPMVALSFLEKSVAFSRGIPLPKKVSHGGYYPSRYTVTYNSVMDDYWIRLNDLQRTKDSF